MPKRLSCKGCGCEALEGGPIDENQVPCKYCSQNKPTNDIDFFSENWVISINDGIIKPFFEDSTAENERLLIRLKYVVWVFEGAEACKRIFGELPSTGGKTQ